MAYKFNRGTFKVAGTVDMSSATDIVHKDGTVDNADLAGSIADSKLATISTADKVALAAVDIDGATALGGATVAQADLLIIDDGAGGTNKSVTFSNFEDSIFANISGDAAVAAGGALTIAAGAVEHGMLAEDIISGQAALGSASVAQADLLMLDDGPGTVKKVTFSNFEDSIFGNISGDATVAAGGALTIAAGAVENSMLADDAVGADELAANAVVNASVASNAAIAYSKMEAVTAGQIMVGNGSNVGTLVAVSGDVTMSNAGAVTIAANAVEGSMLNTDAISAQTALASGLTATDELMVSDGGTLKRMDVSVLSDFQAGDGIASVSGQFKVDSVIDTVIGSSGHNYTSATGVYVCGANAVTGSEMVFLNGQMLMPGASLAAGDYTIATGSVELHPDLKLDGDDILRVYYLI